MSFIFHTADLPFRTTTTITAWAALCVCESIEDIYQKIGSDVTPRIKWVNDILIEGKKVCGILTETLTGSNGTIHSVVVGIGINITTKTDDFPTEIQSLVTSLFPNEEAAHTRNELCAAIISRMLSKDHYKNDADVMSAYRNRLILKQRILVSQGEEKFEAFARDIDERGQLIVVEKDGTERILCSGDISLC